MRLVGAKAVEDGFVSLSSIPLLKFDSQLFADVGSTDSMTVIILGHRPIYSLPGEWPVPFTNQLVSAVDYTSNVVGHVTPVPKGIAHRVHTGTPDVYREW